MKISEAQFLTGSILLLGVLPVVSILVFIQSMGEYQTHVAILSVFASILLACTLLTSVSSVKSVAAISSLGENEGVTEDQKFVKWFFLLIVGVTIGGLSSAIFTLL